MSLTKEQIKAALEVLRTVADTIRELGSVPNGELYTQMMPFIDLATYNKVIETLKGAGLVKEELHILKWVGPQPEKQVATPGNDQSFRTREDAEFWIKQERRTGNFRSIVGPVVDKDGWWHVAVERRVA